MPLYEYECERCGEREDHFFTIAAKRERVRCGCGGMARAVISAPALHTLATFSADIKDEYVQRSRDPGDGSYFDPNLCDPDTGKSYRITSRKQREEVIRNLGLQEKPMSDKARDVQRLKQTRPVHFH